MVPGYTTPPPPQNVPAEIRILEREQPNREQQTQELNNTIEDIGDGVAKLKEGKDDAEENEERSNALNGPGYADYTDPPPESTEQALLNDVNQGKYGDGFTASLPQQEPSSSENNGKSTDPAQSSGDDYDYYNGIGG